MSHKIAKKVAKQYLSAVLCDYLQQSVTQARLNLDKLESLHGRATRLIDESEQREHIYKEAGDMIFTYKSAVEDLRDQLATLSYLSARLGMGEAKNEMPSGLRKEIDRAIKDDKQ